MWMYLLKKGASLIIAVCYRNVPEKYKYFYRDTIVCKLNQVRYFLKDFILKKPYKVISFEGEFAAELQFALPFAYWHFKNGTLKSTRSFPLTKELYFFSPDHTEVFTERSNEGNYNFELPRILYSQDYHIKKWLPLPLKSTYQNDVYHFDKPMLIIANKFNSEWDAPPVNYISLAVLDTIITQLKDQYTIIYNRPQSRNIINDNSAIYDLNDFEWLRSTHPEVLLLEDLFNENKIKAHNFNHFQLCVYANCANFISVHGGTATLASYFGGKNLILSKEGPEHYFSCFQQLYPQFSGATIYHAASDNELLALAKEIF